MIDHVLGRPSVTFRKYQVFAVVAFWSAYLLRGNRHGPPIGRRFSRFLSKRLTTWQTLVVTLLWLYVARNFGKLIGLECPEPLADLYTRPYFRATWFTTALDAGFWSAMHIKRRWWRDVVSMGCSVYYLICAEQADEKVRKIRSVLTVDHLRVSWNKGTTPYLAFINKLVRPRLMRYSPRAIRIPRPEGSAYSNPVQGWLYFDGPISALKRYTKIVLNVPGGGWVAMNPRTHDDALLAWAGKTGLPVLSLDYKKAPEFPYPYAINECYDVYQTIIASRGRCIGLSGENLPQIVVSGDSAGGNLATGMVLMILQSGSTNTRRWLGEANLPAPAGLVLLYPSLDMNIGNWMTDEQMALIRDRHTRKINKSVVKHKSQDFRKLAPSTPLPSDYEDDGVSSPPRTLASKHETSQAATRHPQPPAIQLENDTAVAPLKTRLATPSLISYVSDRILTPEMMRAMIILYVGPHNKPDFSTEYLLSPVLAPDALLAMFPKTYFLTGERDPLVDDTVIMAGRLRQAKAARWQERQELGLLSAGEVERGFVEKDHVEVKLVEGISHGFTQFAGVFPEAWDFIYLCGRWYEEAFALAEKKVVETVREVPSAQAMLNRGKGSANGFPRHHHRSTTASSGEDDRPLEMTLTRKSPSPNPATPPSKKEKADAGRVGENGVQKPRNISIPPPGDLLGESSTSALRSPETPYSSMAREHPLGTARRRKEGSRSRSMVSLASEDDLLGRRMKGLVGGLTRVRNL